MANKQVSAEVEKVLRETYQIAEDEWKNVREDYLNSEAAMLNAPREIVALRIRDQIAELAETYGVNISSA